jgi:hypothetical protein
MRVFWFFFAKKNRKRFFLEKEAKTFVYRPCRMGDLPFAREGCGTRGERP